MESVHQSIEFLKLGNDTVLLPSPQEKMLRVSKKQQEIIIGIPRERQSNEKRVALTPGAVGVLIEHGHKVIVEHNAGELAHFTDAMYAQKGATIAMTAAEVFTIANVIVKIAPLDDEELDFLQTGQTLISAVHMGAVSPKFIKALMEKNVSAFGFEFIQAADGSTPVMQIMSQIAGIASITIASELLASNSGSRGMLLGGITGVPPATISIIGAGTVGYYASKSAVALGAQLRVFDEVHRLKLLQDLLKVPIYTAVNQMDYIADSVAVSDVLIGAAYTPGQLPPRVVTEEMVMRMREGSVIIDVAIDQGGCIETSRATSHDDPVFEKYGILHYCVPNIPSRVPQTASIAVSNILCPMLISLGESPSINDLFASSVAFRTGVYVYHKHVTKRILAGMFNFDFMDIELLYAAMK